MRNEADPVVVAWLDRQPPQSIWTTVITVFEIRLRSLRTAADGVCWKRPSPRHWKNTSRAVCCHLINRPHWPPVRLRRSSDGRAGRSTSVTSRSLPSPPRGRRHSRPATFDTSGASLWSIHGRLSVPPYVRARRQCPVLVKARAALSVVSICCRP